METASLLGSCSGVLVAIVWCLKSWISDLVLKLQTLLS